MRLAESRKQGGMASFSGVTRSMAARERRIEPSQTPKFLSPFPGKAGVCFWLLLPYPPRLLGWRHLGSLGRMKKGGLGVPAIKQVRLLYVPLMFSTKIKQRRY